MSTSRRMLLINNNDDMAKKDIIITMKQTNQAGNLSWTTVTTLDDLATQMGTTKSDLITKGSSVRTSSSVDSNWHFFKNFNFYIYVIDVSIGSDSYDGIYPVTGIYFTWNSDISSKTIMNFITRASSIDLKAAYNLA